MFHTKYRTEDFDFHLPESLIAQYPTQKRSASRLLKLDGNSGQIADETFEHISHSFIAGDLLILNDTKVIKARLFGQKISGGKIEVMIERILDTHRALAQIKASKAPKIGGRVLIADTHEAEVIGRQDDLFLLQFLDEISIMDILERHGTLPLPPYIAHTADQTDEMRYQTVFAKNAGAVAAPTAGLHFDDAILEQLKAKGVNIAYVTLHVGAGTFKPVKVDNILEHKMHSELYHIPQATVDKIRHARENNNRITAVGTTVLRALESAALHGLPAGSGETNIFITPGFEFEVVDRLLTNFHLPKSTLLMLVAAFAGFDNVRRAYQHAIEMQYRFFSYGDAMLIERQQ